MKPWKDKSTSRQARQSEEQAAQSSGGRRVPMSGAGKQKGDVKTSRWLIEDKLTEANSYRVEGTDLDEIVVHAVRAHRLPQFRITVAGRTWRMIREKDYLALGLDD